MKFKPTRLFGVEQRNKPCYFIHENGEGFWFISHKERTVGEARMLKDISTDIEALEIDSNWLLLEISKVNHAELLAQIKEKDFKIEDKDIATLNKNEQERLIEVYVRTLISDLEFANPVLWKYKDKLESNISKNRAMFFDYQMRVVKTIFKCRVITDNSVVVMDDKDIEKGYVTTSDLTNKNVVGLIEDFDYDDLPESLALKIYNYANRDFAGLDIETTAMIEAKEKQAKIEAATTQEKPSIPNESDLKKTPTLEPLIVSDK